MQGSTIPTFDKVCESNGMTPTHIACFIEWLQNIHMLGVENLTEIPEENLRGFLKQAEKDAAFILP